MQLNWSSPFSSHRAPAMARNVVVSSQPLAVQAGIAMLARGGNAVDAALATAIALTVVEPPMNGIGGDAFAIVWKDGRLHGLNASGRSPQGWSPERFAGLERMPSTGWDSVTVPGCVSAWAKLSETHGRLPFADLFEPAVRYARDGFHVTPVTARTWKLQAEDRLAGFGEFQRVFCPSGRAPRAGELFRNPEQAETLGLIASSHGEAFYRGSLARRICKAAAEAGGAMTEQDLADHEAFFVDPVSIEYRGLRLHEMPPNGQGLAALIALGILRQFEAKGFEPESAEWIHLQIESMKLALADADAWIADSDFMRTRTVEDMLDSAYLGKRAKLIDPGKASVPEAGVPGCSDTVYLTAADADGTMVSYIQSNYQGFGSGIVVPGTGIAMQNRGEGFSVTEGHPNRVAGGKRPFHTIIPGFVTRNGEPLMSFGVMGGRMQALGHLQMMTRLADFSQTPQDAADAPRWQVLGEHRVGVEESMPKATITGLMALGHEVEVMPPSNFGGAQLALRIDGGYLTGSDPRKDGQAAGF